MGPQSAVVLANRGGSWMSVATARGSGHGDALGGMGQTPLQPMVRIAYVQHTAAAMARGIDLVPER